MISSESSRGGCVHLYKGGCVHLYKGGWVHLYSQRGGGAPESRGGCVQQGWVCPPVYSILFAFSGPESKDFSTGHGSLEEGLQHQPWVAGELLS